MSYFAITFLAILVGTLHAHACEAWRNQWQPSTKTKNLGKDLVKLENKTVAQQELYPNFSLTYSDTFNEYHLSLIKDQHAAEVDWYKKQLSGLNEKCEEQEHELNVLKEHMRTWVAASALTFLESGRPSSED